MDKVRFNNSEREKNCKICEFSNDFIKKKEKEKRKKEATEPSDTVRENRQFKKFEIKMNETGKK